MTPGQGDRAVYGSAPLLDRLLEQRAYADYSTEFTTSTETLAGLVEQAATFVERCRAVVADAQLAGPDEADPPPDY